MAAIIMPSITSLITQLKKDFSELHFEKSDAFRWHPASRAVTYDPASSDTAALLHEVAHALLDHQTFLRDLELLQIERAAWIYVFEVLGPKYDTRVTNEEIEFALDTYRDWLHARSTCPTCQATGIQYVHSSYQCIACQTVWKVNDARSCALRRYRQSKIAQE